MNAPVDPLPEGPKGPKFDQSNLIQFSIVTIALTLIGGFIVFLLADLFNAVTNSVRNFGLVPDKRIARGIDLVKTVFAVSWLIIALIYGYRYLLSDKRDATLEALRERTARKEGAGSWYRHAVERALEVTDRFFGDEGKADQSWQPRAFGLLRAEAPLWTAASYDKCLSIALIYPLFCIYAVWALTGDAGDAGSSVGLINGWDEAHAGRVVTIIAMIGGCTTIALGRKWIRLLGAIIPFLAGAFAIVSGALGDGDVIDFFYIVAATIFSFIGVGVITGVLFSRHAIILIIGLAFGFGIIIFSPDTGLVTLLGIMVFTYICCFALDFIHFIAEKQKLLTLFYWIFTVSFGTFCVLIPCVAASWFGWSLFGALLYFLPLLTLINGPFDWAALGITRALLRKGLEKEGGWPILYGFIDLLISLATIAVLGATLILFTQVFNAMTLLGGAKEVIFDPLKTLHEIADSAMRDEPRYYWLYLMLLTTQLPAILNLAAGFFAVMRTADIGTDWLARFAAPGAATTVPMRLWLAALQATQVAIALTLGFIALGVIYYGILKGIEFTASTTMLDLFLSIAQANWPARWFGV